MSYIPPNDRWVQPLLHLYYGCSGLYRWPILPHAPCALLMLLVAAKLGSIHRSTACLVGWFVSLQVREEVLLAGLCERKILFRLKIYDRLRQAIAKRIDCNPGCVSASTNPKELMHLLETCRIHATCANLIPRSWICWRSRPTSVQQWVADSHVALQTTGKSQWML